MTRPKVDPDKRLRTAQACESCKRRKQKCNGLNPCNTCTKRNLNCSYESLDNGADDHESPPKRRMVESQTAVRQHSGPSTHPSILGHRPSNVKQKEVETSFEHVVPTDVHSRGSTTDDNDEVAVVYNSTRMLQDPTGRLLYVGDAATLSFLQLIRMIVDNVIGPTPFTTDPKRHKIVENAISVPQNIRRTHLLPDRLTGEFLVKSYFTNTQGLVEIFQRDSFMTTLDSCYNDPLNIDPSWLCLLYLTFAIGLILASPTPGTAEYAIIKRLREDPIDRAEIFYLNAKDLSHPSTGFEDDDFWSIQALALMSVYMLVVSKRNAAYAYYGMAVRSAFALGLHREETMCIFSGTEQLVRRKLWMSLFVLDRFLSASLGRPTAIRESDCSDSLLSEPESPPYLQASSDDTGNASSHGLLAAVRSCRVIGIILEKVYSKRKISTKLAQEIADECKDWPRLLDPSLHWQLTTSNDAEQGIAILHVNLFYCHSIVLLTRPFFLYLMNQKYRERQEDQPSRRRGVRMDKFGEACVIASSHSISLVQNTFENGRLPHRNPFVIYFLFAAALVVLSNEFAALYQNPTSTTFINNAIHIMSFCAQHDPQANRLLFILTSFSDVVERRKGCKADHSDLNPASQIPIQPSSVTFEPQGINPMANLRQSTQTSHQRLRSPRLHHNSTDPTIVIQSSSGIPDVVLSASEDIHQAYLSRADFLDTFLDLAQVPTDFSGGSNDGYDSNSAADGEIDFESLWQWPNSKIGLDHSDRLGFGIDTSAVKEVLESTLPNHAGIQNFNNSQVPLFGVPNANFGGI